METQTVDALHTLYLKFIFQYIQPHLKQSIPELTILNSYNSAAQAKQYLATLLSKQNQLIDTSKEVRPLLKKAFTYINQNNKQPQVFKDTILSKDISYREKRQIPSQRDRDSNSVDNKISINKRKSQVDKLKERKMHSIVLKLKSVFNQNQKKIQQYNKVATSKQQIKTTKNFNNNFKDTFGKKY